MFSRPVLSLNTSALGQSFFKLFAHYFIAVKFMRFACFHIQILHLAQSLVCIRWVFKLSLMNFWDWVILNWREALQLLVSLFLSMQCGIIRHLLFCYIFFNDLWHSFASHLLTEVKVIYYTVDPRFHGLKGERGCLKNLKVKIFFIILEKWQ